MLKIPPHNLEAEQAVLGSLLIDKEGITVVGDKITSKDFYDEIHADIFETICWLYENHRPVDVLTLSNALKNKGLLEKIGGNAYLIELTNIVPTSSNIGDYADIVKNKSILRNLAIAGNAILKYSYDENSQLSELLEKAEKEVFNVTQTSIQNRLVHIKEIVGKRYSDIAELNAHPELIDKFNVKTGYSGLDNLLIGFKPGDLCILAARPAMGKTAFALNLAKNIGSADKILDNGQKIKKTVAIFSLEMTKEQLTDRMISSTIGLNSWKMAKGDLTDDEFSKVGDAMEKLSKLNIYIDDSAGGNLMEIKSKARRLKIQHGIDLIIIDYLQLMSNGNSLNRVQEISEISRGLKSLARELCIPVIALSQLSRAVENRPDKRPMLSDLRESGSIEQDADSVLMMYREDYYSDGTDSKDGPFEAEEQQHTTPESKKLEEEKKQESPTIIFIRKNRSGPTGEVKLKFKKQFQEFIEIDERYNSGYLN